MQILGVVESPDAIRAILDSLALASRPPPDGPPHLPGAERVLAPGPA